MLEKSKVTRKYYNVDTLSFEEKVRLGFNEAVKKELSEKTEQQKKSPAKRKKIEKTKGD